MIVTCLIGDPVQHSVSNYMYDYFANEIGIEYSHVKFRISSKNKNNLKLAIDALRALGIKGANVTLPYKTEVMKYLDRIDGPARLAGAVNTILNRNNKLIGYNTDGRGAIMGIERHLKRIDKDDYITILGAGGAARAILFELLKKTKNITIINRKVDFSIAENLKLDFKKIGKKIEILPLNDANIISGVSKANIIINATPVGMFPKTRRSLISEDHFKKINEISAIENKYFFDVIFNPQLTKLLLISKRYGAKICSGLYMLIYQGTESFKIWTGVQISNKRAVKNLEILKRKVCE